MNDAAPVETTSSLDELQKAVHAASAGAVASRIGVDISTAFHAVKEKARQNALDAKQRAAQKFWLEKLRAAAKVETCQAAHPRLCRRKSISREIRHRTERSET